MAIIEYEIESRAFAGLVSNQVKMGPPVPTPTLDILGADRLISSTKWGSAFSVEADLPGYMLAFGSILLKAPLELWHVSIDELRLDPDSFGTHVALQAWLSVSTGATAGEVNLVGIALSGGTASILSQPVRLCRLPLPVAAFSTFTQSGFYNLGQSVVFRVGTTPTDKLAGSTSSRLSQFLNPPSGDTSSNWLLHIPSGLFVDLILQRMVEQLTPPPSGVVIEEMPRASWLLFPNGQWGVSGSLGVEKPDACPGLFGSVDISADVSLSLNFSAPPAGDSLDFTMGVSVDASDWDSARCWLGSGAALGWLLGHLDPLLGVGSTIGSLIFVSEEIRSSVGEQSATFASNDLTLVSQTTSSSTYAGSYPMQPVPGTFGDVLTLVAADGLTARGTTIANLLVNDDNEPTFIPDPVHTVTFTPNGGTLATDWKRTINCSLRSMDSRVNVPVILVSDDVAFNGVTTAVTVRVFLTSHAEPAGKYHVDLPFSTSFPQPVTISTGMFSHSDDGFAVIHTSAGLSAYRIDAPATSTITLAGTERLIHERCDALHELQTEIEIHEIKWVEEPIGYHFGIDAVRQWQVRLEGLHENTDITIGVRRNGQLDATSWERELVRTGSRAWGEFLTDAQSELTLHVGNQVEQVMVQTNQRWLIPVSMSEPIEAAHRLKRTGETIQIETALTRYEVETSQMVTFSKESDSTDTNRVAATAILFENGLTAIQSISLPDNQVAFLNGDRVVVALAHTGVEVL